MGLVEDVEMRFTGLLHEMNGMKLNRSVYAREELVHSVNDEGVPNALKMYKGEKIDRRVQTVPACEKA